MIMEIWKEIEGWQGYEVSTLGRIKSLKGKVEKILVPNNCHKSGYLTIYLCNKKIKKRLYIHRLVAQAFIPNPNGYKEINHIKPVSLEECDNRVENLEWCSKSHNMKYRAICGNQKMQVLNVEDVKSIRELYSTGKYTQKVLADMFNYKQPNISRIVNFQIW